MIYYYSLWASDTTPPEKIRFEQLPSLPSWGKLGTAEMEVRFNRYDKQNDYNFWAYSDKLLNLCKLSSLFNQLKKHGMNAKVDLGAYYE
ncbi:MULTISPECIES: hypothetical protein [unclassified Moraxella]|uniref:hypothetical protein n=1 Tax=unclassified Moraxella TaxID=2685852 RepID=UPI002B409CE7|nr:MULTISPECIES: hypothetical protein [unclassified Moraxella]